MGLSIEEQRNKIRARNKLLCIQEVSHKVKIKKLRSKPDGLTKNRIQSIKLMENQLNFNSPNERRFREILIENNIKHVWQKPFYDEVRYICVDFYFQNSNIVIEIDGLEHEERTQYDLDRTMYLKRTHGIKEVLRVTNKELALTPDNIREYLLDKLD